MNSEGENHTLSTSVTVSPWVRVITVFLLLWQFLYRVSDSAMDSLFCFLCKLFKAHVTSCQISLVHINLLLIWLALKGASLNMYVQNVNPCTCMKIVWKIRQTIKEFQGSVNLLNFLIIGIGICEEHVEKSF